MIFMAKIIKKSIIIITWTNLGENIYMVLSNKNNTAIVFKSYKNDLLNSNFKLEK